MEGFTFFLGQLGNAFSQMMNFELILGLNVFTLSIILIVLNLVITIFLPLPGIISSGIADAKNEKRYKRRKAEGQAEYERRRAQRQAEYEARRSRGRRGG